ncbi:efflux RND transporter periplasmic adaptor subunit [Alteromonas facilis]|uniref:efflux RND transporter periplasmic adaptor subunit n=1 Tax=Alteromonas facilis TaxID=2048004 RepID=UPI000C2941A2|nr:HlyD family efflux transporter periplasmic adaptor subunit [Alteromonas facilis]
MIRDTSSQDVIIKDNGRVKRFAIFAGIALLTVGFAANALLNTSGAQKSVDRGTLQIAQLERGDLVRDIVANGRVVAANAPQLYAPQQGFVELNVKPGDQVTVGEVVAQVESPELANQLKQENSEMQRLEGELARQELDARRQTLELTKRLDLAEVDLQAAERESRRANQSIKNNLISQIDHEEAIDDLARAKLNFKHAQEEVSLAKDTLAFELESSRSTVQRQALVVEELKRKLDELTIRASVDGVVGNLLVQPKALVDKNTPLMTLVDLSAYEAEIQVAESYANELNIGLPVEIRIGNQRIEGVVASVSPEIKQREITTRVRLRTEDISQLRQNQQVTARVLLENKANVLKVRRGSFTQAGGYIAYKVEGDLAHKVDIRLGAYSMRDVEVLEGLQESDQIIISTYQQFEDADTILLRQ